MFRRVLLVLVLFTAPLLSEEYIYHPTVPTETWDRLKPFFLPEDHPLKPKLDKIFMKRRATTSKKSLEKAGFTFRRFKEETHFAVVFHEKFPDYVLKIFTDEAPDDEWFNFWKRVVGSRIVRDAIDRHNYHDLFTVPQKWIYPLPQSPEATGPYPKHFILVAERIDTYPGSRNFGMWESCEITPQILDAYYVLLQEEGLNDSIYPSNVPFTRKGKLAFIDTEHFHNWPIFFEKTTKYLSKPNQNYWQNLISNGGPK